MDHQRSMLRSSLVLMTSPKSPEAIEHTKIIGKSHSRSGYNIKPELYDQWLDCLMVAVKTHDEFYESSIDKAWRDHLAQGISAMKSMY